MISELTFDWGCLCLQCWFGSFGISYERFALSISFTVRPSVLYTNQGVLQGSYSIYCLAPLSLISDTVLYWPFSFQMLQDSSCCTFCGELQWSTISPVSWYTIKPSWNFPFNCSIIKFEYGGMIESYKLTIGNLVLAYLYLWKSISSFQIWVCTCILDTCPTYFQTGMQIWPSRTLQIHGKM